MIDQHSIDRVLSLCTSLSTEEKAELLKNIYPSLPPEKKGELLKFFLGNDEQIQVTFGNSQVTASTVYQLNLQNPEQMADIIGAIADRIRGDRNNY